MSRQTFQWLRDAKRSIDEWRTRRSPMFLSKWIPDPDRIRVFRRRAEFAKDLLENASFTEACQMMNEQIVENIAACEVLDKDRLLVLKLRLELVSEFPQVLAMFVDQYEEIKIIQQQRDKEDQQQEVA